jgi:hypothetical protein
MSFREYLNWKHYALIIIWPALSFVSNPVAYESVAELAGALVGGPLVVLALIYVYYAVKHKSADTATA